MGRKKGRRKAPFQFKLKPDIIKSIMAVALWLLAGLLVVSFSGQGKVLQAIQSLFSRTFGPATLILPFLLVSGGLMISQVNWRVAKPTVLWGGVLMFVAFLGLIQGGSAGNRMFDNIAQLIHPIGAFMLLTAIGVIGFMIMTETAISELLQFMGNLFGKIFRRKSMATQAAPTQLKIKGSGDARIDTVPEPTPEIRVRDNKPKLDTKIDAETEETLSKAIVTNNDPSRQTLWQHPPMSLLSQSTGGKADRGDLKKNAATIESLLDSFGIKAKVVEVNCGPAVTQYALEISLGTKLSKITALQNDLALALAAPTGQIRIEAPIPGRSLVGVEIPNKSPEFVTLRTMLSSDVMKKSKSKLTVALGLNVAGEPMVMDINKMPHILIAGSTGSGKSVCLNTFLASILFRASPDEVKLIMIDPKRVELTGYNDIPHLLAPVIVDPQKAGSSLKWAVTEMHKRYQLFSEAGVRNIESYNEMSGFQAIPYIVIVIDELADIMLFSPKEVEDSIIKIAQMARAVGIHLVLATQRPSVDVLTGLIKANVPARIAFNVASMVDSRVILDTVGAEKLLGRGDMLYTAPSASKPTRIQGAFVSDKEINALIDYIKNMGIAPQYTEEVTTKFGSPKITSTSGQVMDDADKLFTEAVKMVIEHKKASASMLQRYLSVGYSRAARIIDQLETAGVVSPQEGSKPRQILINSPEELFGSDADKE